MTRICGTTSTCVSPRAQWTTTTSRSSETTSTSAPFPVSPHHHPYPCFWPPSLLQAVYSLLFELLLSSASLYVFFIVFLLFLDIISPSLLLQLYFVLSLCFSFPSLPSGRCPRVFTSHSRSFSPSLTVYCSFFSFNRPAAELSA